MHNIDAYPLTWPVGWKRTDSNDRRGARFGKGDQTWNEFTKSYHTYERKITVSEGICRLIKQLRNIGAENDFVVSSNVEVRLDGLPYSNRKEPSDPGVAVYWRDARTDKDQVIAIDIYDRVADNLGAIAATLDAMRSIERHGGAQILERAFTGFTALPPPISMRHWSTVLGISKSADQSEIKSAYLRRRSSMHSDKGGSDAEFIEVQQAYEQALSEG